jgi:hypothetical protein
MQVRKAKDFLVNQAIEQARLESAPLSDLERRMMYFTEGPDAAEDPVALNEEFEKKYQTDEYETKVKKATRERASLAEGRAISCSRGMRGKPKSSRPDRRLHSYSVRPKCVGKIWKS